MSYQTYSDEQRAEALAALTANGGNIAKTAREVGVPRKTLSLWTGGSCKVALGPAAQFRPLKERDLAKAFEELAWKAVGIAPGKMEDAPLNHVMTAAGIATDKMLLLRGEPTAILKRTAAKLDAMSLEDKLRESGWIRPEEAMDAAFEVLDDEDEDEDD